jgi:methionyl-tRNA synthetase
MNKFYITTAIPYVNAKPHIGHALEFIQADVLARYHRLIGDETLLLTGSDENALKNVQAAEEADQNTQEFVDQNANLFKEALAELNIDFDIFQKGSDTIHHYPSAQKLWGLCFNNGDIYKKTYKGLYCLGCEAFYTREELNEQGECFEHPGKKLEEVKEENYFFKLSNYQDQLIKIIESDEYRITPQFRKNEILSFLKSGLQDISISRTNQRAKNWGVPIPNDPSQRIYVWFDALNIYQSGIGFGWDEEKYARYWPADTHVIGKGIIRFHAVYWPAILLSAGLKLPKNLFVHEYFTVNGQKMSKTLGNVLDPLPLIKKYGVDAVRYYCLAKVSPFQDGDISEDKLATAYNSDLANGLGNLIARVAKLCEKSGFETSNKYESFDPEVEDLIKEYKFNEALNWIWEIISIADRRVNEEKPWELTGIELEEVLEELVDLIHKIAFNLKPFMPDTAEKILKQFEGKVVSSAPLFPRI